MDGEQVQGTQYAVGQRVRVCTPLSSRFGQVGTVQGVQMYEDRIKGKEIKYPLYEVDMDDKSFPNPITCTDWAIDLAGAAQEAAQHDNHTDGQ